MGVLNDVFDSLACLCWGREKGTKKKTRNQEPTAKTAPHPHQPTHHACIHCRSPCTWTLQTSNDKSSPKKRYPMKAYATFVGETFRGTAHNKKLPNYVVTDWLGQNIFTPPPK